MPPKKPADTQRPFFDLIFILVYSFQCVALLSKQQCLYELFFVTAECGDYVVEDYPDHTYLSTFKFVPQQDGQLERRIMENHKKHV